MNEEYIKEYEEMSLCDFADELVEPLSTVKQDLTKTIYIHYAEERDKKEQLQNNWNELKKFINEWIIAYKNNLENRDDDIETIFFKSAICELRRFNTKMQELEQQNEVVDKAK